MLGIVEGRFIADASVVVKWCLGGGEERVTEALVFLDAHLDGTAHAHVLDLTFYEVGNALSQHPFSPPSLSSVLAPLNEWDVGVLGTSDPAGSEFTCEMVTGYGLSFYDASYLAAARLYEMPLVTDDYALFEAAKAEGWGIGLSDI